MAKWWCIASLLLCLAVAAGAARDVPTRNDCDTVAVVAGRDDAGAGAGVDEAKTLFAGSNGGGLFGGVNGPLGGGIVGFGPQRGFGAGGGLLGGFGGGGGFGGEEAAAAEWCLKLAGA